MIDIHCHILPGFDDGPQHLEEALKMAKIAVKDGIHTIVATPHCFDDVYDCQQKDIDLACQELEQACVDRGIKLRIVPGAEVRITPEFIEHFNDNQIPLLGKAGEAVLLELPQMFIIDGITRIIRLLQGKSVRCIVAHPERNSQIVSRPDIVPILVHSGAEMKITAGSLLGDFGKEQKQLAIQILESSACCWLASDAHCSRRRTPKLKKALKVAGKIIGKKSVKKLVSCDIDRTNMYKATQVS